MLSRPRSANSLVLRKPHRMQDASIAETDLSADLIGLFAEIPWPTMLVSADGHILALNAPVRELLGADAATALGQPVETHVVMSEPGRLLTLLGQGAGSCPPIQAHLLRPGLELLPVEIEIVAVPDDPHGRVTVLVHPISLHHRHQQLILELNRLAPALLALDTPDEVFRRTAAALEPLGLGLAITLRESEDSLDSLRYATVSAAVVDYMRRATGFQFAGLPVPATTPGYDEAIIHRKAVFWDDIDTLIRGLMPPAVVALCRALWRLYGVRNLIFAPLLIGDQAQGVLVLWSPLLSREDTPFVEALAHQIAAVLAQIEVRRRMASHIQRLESLATTANAVTTLGSLEDVLRVICQQASDLLGGDHSSAYLPTGEDDAIVCVMVTGQTESALMGMHMPLQGSIVGQVFSSGRGRWLTDAAAAPGTYQPAIRASGARSSLLQPLCHRGSVLGVLVVSHSQPNRFVQDDLEYLARYAEHAAVAVANARLHEALQQSEHDQRRRRREQAAILKVSEAVNRALDLDIILHEGLRVLDELRLIFIASVYLRSADGASFELRASRNVSPELLSRFANMPIGHLVIGNELMRVGQIQVLGPAALARLHLFYPELADLGLTSVAVAPLIAEKRTFGVLLVTRADGQIYRDQELRLLEAIANQLAQAVVQAQNHQALEATATANARLYREAEGVRSYLNTLMQHTPDVLLTIRQDMTIHALNPERLAAVIGYRPEQVEGRMFMDFIPKSRHADLLPRWNAVLAGQPQTLEAEIIGADGRLLVAIMSAALIPDYGEVFLIVKDVTVQKQLEIQLHQSEKLAALGRLVAGAAHELNNPLAVILGLAQLELLEDLPPAQRADMEQIERAALRASHIVEHLRTFARPQPAEPQPLDLSRLIDDTLGRLSAEIAARSIGVEVSIDADLPQLVADAHQLEQVLFNIIQNAVLALVNNAPDTPRVLTIRAVAVSGAARLTIADTGPGIAPEHLARIFDPFFTTRRVGEGSGLGLSIVHAIVKQHGGRIWAESEPGHGTTFYVDLPLGVTVPAPVPDHKQLALPAARRILLVEDEDSVRAVATRGLERLGYQVKAVADGAAALEQALAHDYDLVISDIQMPGMDGVALYRQLHELRPALRWLILTGDTMGERSRTFLEEVALPVLPKPFTRDQLAACVAESLGVKRDKMTR
jgi:PAS domain S-box-containing protein